MCSKGTPETTSRHLRLGYARVSSAEQNLDRQTEALRADGVEERFIFTDKISGAKRENRPGLNTLLQLAKRGDTVVVTSPDRLGRNFRELLDINEELEQEGVAVEFLQAKGLSGISGTMILRIMAAVADAERGWIRERQAEGIAQAKKRGAYRKPSLTEDKIAWARGRIAEGVPKAELARQLGVHRSTLYNALNGTGVYSK